MVLSSAFAPHFGAALAAALLLSAGLAFQAGATGDALTGVEAVTSEAGPDQSLALSATLDAPELADQSAALPLMLPASGGPQLAVIIDDVGLDPVATGRLLGLGVPLTLSILPYAPGAPEIARAARDAGLDVFLHLPMEPVGLEDPGPHALTRHLSSADIAARVVWSLSRVPGATGFNNHMGSRFTADAAAMDAVFDAARPDLIFVDSLTSPDSVAATRAISAGYTAYKRDIFIDHLSSREAALAGIEAAVERAHERGQAIAIAHPRDASLEALTQLAEIADAAGVQLVTVSGLRRPAESGEAPGF